MPTCTPHQVSPSTSSTPHHSQTQLPYPPTPGAVAPQPPHTVHQQYATHYQQHPMGTVIPQQSPQARPLFGPPTPGGHSMTPPIAPNHPPQAPPIPGQPTNTPLAYSTLNVNVSSLTPSRGPAHPGGAAPPTYQYPTPGGPPRAATPPSGSLVLHPKSFATGANAYPIQSYNKVMSSFIGSGQVGVTTPVGPAHLGGVRGPVGVGRGSVNSAPPRPLPHPRGNLGYPAGHVVPTLHIPPHTGVGGASAPWPHP